MGSDKGFESMTVPLLKEQLKARRLSTSGLKAALVQRLVESVEEEQAAKGPDALEDAPSATVDAIPDDLEPMTAPSPEPEKASAPEPIAPVPESAAPKSIPEPAHVAQEARDEPMTVHELLGQVEDDDMPEDLPSEQHADAPAAAPDLAKSPAPAQPSQPSSAPAVIDVPTKDTRMGGGETPVSEPKRKREAILFAPPERKASLPMQVRPETPKANKRLETPKTDNQVKQPCEAPAEAEAVAVEPSAPAAKRPKLEVKPALKTLQPMTSPRPAAPAATPTCHLFIGGLMRPFTEAALRQLLGEAGAVMDLWLPFLKTHAVVSFGSEEEAEAARQATHMLKWPVGTQKMLQPRFISKEEAEQEKAAGSVRGASGPGLAPLVPTRGGGVIAALKASQLQAALRGAGAAAAATAPAGAAPTDVAAPVPDPKATPLPRDDGSTEEVKVHAPSIPEPAAVAAQEEEKVLMLDDLFRKTTTKPPLYYLPLTDEQVAAKKVSRVKSASPVNADEKVK